MIKSEYKTPEELLNFILTECGDMEYYDTNLYHKHLIIRNNFDMEKAFYAIKFLKEYFNIEIKILMIKEIDPVITDGYLENTKITELYITGTTKLPKLPKTIKRIQYGNPDDDRNVIMDIHIIKTSHHPTMSHMVRYYMQTEDETDRCLKYITQEYKCTSLEEALEKARNL